MMAVAFPEFEPVADEARLDEMERFADAALGLAGHQITDPVLRELGRKKLRGELSDAEVDEAILLRIKEIREAEREAGGA